MSIKPCFPPSKPSYCSCSSTEHGKTSITVLNETTDIQSIRVNKFTCTVGYNV